MASGTALNTPFVCVAENAVGTSEAVNVSATPQTGEVIGTLPGPVVNLTATGANREVRVNWSAPSDDGGAAIIGYSVLYRRTNGDWERWPHSGTSTSATVTGLVGGTRYEVEVTAHNIIGHGQSEVRARVDGRRSVHCLDRRT